MAAFEQQTALNQSPIHGLWALTNRELKRWYKAPIILILSLIQPVIWLGLFGKAMNFGAIFTGGSFNIPGLNIPKSVLDALAAQIMQQTFGTSDYFSFLAVGMLSFISLFMAMQSGMSMVWDRRLGFLNKELSTPLARGVIPIGKVLSSILRGLTQAAIVLIIAVLLGLDVTHFTIVGLLGTFAGLFLMVMGFSSLFVMLAIRSSNQDTQMMIVNLLNLPLLFASNAMFPAKFMPSWLQPIVQVNPVSYATDISRQLLLGSPGMASVWFDFLYLGVFAVILLVAGTIVSWRFLSR
ncbi:MAG: ABC transporter permease [Thaumarchaeota archaeon]|nr:ABC transporter permease [Nitrososphaerota archaeon]MCL5066923.1 ABC transporter permease [Nitrososphaerota archaeon]